MRKRLVAAIGVLVATSCLWASGASAATRGRQQLCCELRRQQLHDACSSAGRGRPPCRAGSGRGDEMEGQFGGCAPRRVSHCPRGCGYSAAPALPTSSRRLPSPLRARSRAGANTFETRIPVQAGDRFGVFAPAGSSSLVFFCPTASSEDKLGLKEGDVPPGAKATYTPAENSPVGPLRHDRARCRQRRLRRRDPGQMPDDGGGAGDRLPDPADRCRGDVARQGLGEGPGGLQHRSQHHGLRLGHAAEDEEEGEVVGDDHADPDHPDHKPGQLAGLR